MARLIKLTYETLTTLSNDLLVLLSKLLNDCILTNHRHIATMITFTITLASLINGCELISYTTVSHLVLVFSLDYFWQTLFCLFSALFEIFFALKSCLLTLCQDILKLNLSCTLA